MKEFAFHLSNLRKAMNNFSVTAGFKGENPALINIKKARQIISAGSVYDCHIRSEPQTKSKINVIYRLIEVGGRTYAIFNCIWKYGVGTGYMRIGCVYVVRTKAET